MNREEMAQEIERVKIALNKTKSWKLKRDYTKYLRRLCRETAFYDERMRAYRMNTVKSD